MTKIVYGALAYLLITFPWAVLWHLVLLKDFYIEMGYVSKEPIIALGFASILIQGLLLSYIYPRAFTQTGLMANALKFSGLAFIYLWTSHVLSFAAKGHLTSLPLFIGIESLYLALQFLFFGLALGRIYKN